MKQVLITSISLFLFLAGTSQQPSERDGLYYNDFGQLYTGEVLSFFDNGQLEKKVMVINGRLDGGANFYDESGALQETGNYSEGVKNGIWIQFGESGVKTGEAFYRSGFKDGIWTVWDEKGVKRYHMVYSMGEKIDVWKMWDENANLVSERNYSE